MTGTQPEGIGDAGRSPYVAADNAGGRVQQVRVEPIQISERCGGQVVCSRASLLRDQ